MKQCKQAMIPVCIYLWLKYNTVIDILFHSAGAATPSWSHSGSISSHLANHKSTLPSSSSYTSFPTQPLKDMKRKKNIQYHNLVYKPSTSDQHITIDLTADDLSTGTESSLNVANTNAVTVAFDSGSSTKCISDTSTTSDSLKHKDTVNEVLSLLDGELNEEEYSEPMDLSISEILSGGKGNEEEGTPREGEVAQSVVGDKRKIKQRGCEEFMNMGKMKKRKMSELVMIGDTHTHTYIHVHTHEYIHVHCTYTQTHTLYIHVHVHTY